ncbi:MAG: ferric reductase-like transmembrane domain-containing protein [Rhodospirillales bacterium]|nr:ferric reductase-like transmembrane domain-containing protein [Rhodospirillales bacterium]
MSTSYRPVLWYRSKYVYDGVLLVCIVLYISAFLLLAPLVQDPTRPVNGSILGMRAFGTCAFLMLTAILCIGPLARLDNRFLPLLYNRRHFGVLTCIVALTHLAYVLNWYYAFSPTPPWEALLISNTAFGRVLGFPFEIFGLFALICSLILAGTSHDLWLNFLGAPLWKRLHLLIYPAYAAAVAHIALGYLQDVDNPGFALLACGGALLVAGLHLAAARRPAKEPLPGGDGDWVPVCAVSEIPDKRARIVRLGPDERAAVFRYGGKLSAVSHACAHQNGPLGEGRIVYGCITCPWHGYQYRPEDGCSPPPFTEKIPTYRLKLEGAQVSIDRHAKAPGTYVEPVAIPEALQ